MADITYTLNATERRASPGITPGKGNANALQVLATATVEIGAAAATGTTYSMGRIPSNARLSGISQLYWDDLGTNASDLDLGLASVDANITSDPDALSDGHDAATAGSGNAITLVADYGLPAWDFVNGQTTDPGGQLDVYVTLTTAVASTGGTVTVELYGYLD